MYAKPLPSGAQSAFLSFAPDELVILYVIPFFAGIEKTSPLAPPSTLSPFGEREKDLMLFERSFHSLLA